MWIKFENLYQDTGFIKQNTISIQLSNKIVFNFENMIYLINSLKQNFM